MENLPLPNFSVKCGNWVIEAYDDEHETWFKSPDGKTFIVKLTTEDITHIPYYVLKFVHRYKLLDEWVTYQQNLSYSRLCTAITIYQNFIEHKQPVPQEQSITQIPFKLPNFGMS
jgi:hypothetical protein